MTISMSRRGFLRATMFAVPLWALVFALWYLLTAQGGQPCVQV